MALPTVPVSVSVNDSNGDPVPDARVEAKLSQVEVDGGYVLPVHVVTATDADGQAVLNLWPNELGARQSTYEVKITHPVTKSIMKITASVPNRPCQLHEIGV